MWFTMRELGIILFIFALSHNIQAQALKPEACTLEPDEGTGEQVGIYMHYDAKKDNCQPFRYLGQGGNANRYITEKQCMRNCSDRADEVYPKDDRLACMLPKEIGKCFGRDLRYYYSPEENACKTFYWTGCEGNGNRFFSLAICNATCFNIAEDYSGESGVSVGIILGVALGLIGVIVLVVVIFFALKKKKPSSKKRQKKEGKAVEQPLKERAIEMGGGETQPATLEISTAQS